MHPVGQEWCVLCALMSQADVRMPLLVLRVLTAQP